LVKKDEIVITDTKTGKKILPQESPKTHPVQALIEINQNVIAIQEHAQAIKKVTNADITPINSGLMNIANIVKELGNWMITELKINPSQPMNRQQRRRAAKQLKKIQKKK